MACVDEVVVVVVVVDSSLSSGSLFPSPSSVGSSTGSLLPEGSFVGSLLGLGLDPPVFEVSDPAQMSIWLHDVFQYF